MQKENPNPTVHETQKSIHPSHCLSTAHLLGSGDIRRYHLGGSPSPLPFDTASCNSHVILDEDDYSPHWGLITAEERSVTMALSEAAYPNTSSPPNCYPSSTQFFSSPSSSSNDSASSTKLNILQQAGFALYHPQRIQQQCTSIRYPSFAPSSITSHNPEKNSQSTAIHEPRSEEPKRDKITKNEIFQIIRNIQDPEHPLTLEQLNVVRLELVDVVDLKGGDDDDDDDKACPSEDVNVSSAKKFSTVHVQFTPTIPHCSMATLIGLSLRVKLLRSLPSRFKISVKIESGAHVSEHAVNKQLADKERVRAALENEHLVGVVNRCIAGGMQMQ